MCLTHTSLVPHTYSVPHTDTSYSVPHTDTSYSVPGEDLSLRTVDIPCDDTPRTVCLRKSSEEVPCVPCEHSSKNEGPNTVSDMRSAYNLP